jgi:hypothetical protein
MVRLTPHEIRKLAVTGLVAPRTIARCYRGKPVRELIWRRIERAAREVGLPPPPGPHAPPTLRVVDDAPDGGDRRS